MSLETCPHCGQRIRIGQQQLTPAEKSRFDWSGDPHGSPNIIEAQIAKAAADYYDVSDWTAQWDPDLTPGENVALMRERAEPTMRELRHQYND